MAKNKSWETKKQKKQIGVDLYNGPIQKQTTEDGGRGFEHFFGRRAGLDMSGLDHRVSSELADVIDLVSGHAYQDLDLEILGYVGGKNTSPFDFLFMKASSELPGSLGLTFNRDKVAGRGYPPMSGQPSWPKFITTFSGLAPEIIVPGSKDEAYIKKLFCGHYLGMLKIWLADYFFPDIVVWGWASSNAGPGYVIIRSKDVGWSPELKHWDRRTCWPAGLSDGDFRLAKQEPEEWGTLGNDILFWWGGSTGKWIQVGTFKIQRNRDSMQFGFNMSNLMMILGVAARRTGRPDGMFRCQSIREKELWHV